MAATTVERLVNISKITELPGRIRSHFFSSKIPEPDIRPNKADYADDPLGTITQTLRRERAKEGTSFTLLSDRVGSHDDSELERRIQQLIADGIIVQRPNGGIVPAEPTITLREFLRQLIPR